LKKVSIFTTFFVVLFLCLGFCLVSYAATGGTKNESCVACHALFEIEIADPISGTSKSVDMSACSSCHDPFPENTPYYIPNHTGTGEERVKTDYGWFKTAASPGLSSVDIHLAHRGNNSEGSSPGCRYCHGAVDCNACHNFVGHTLHGNPTPVNVMVINRSEYYSKDFTCANAACHDFISYDPYPTDYYGFAVTAPVLEPLCSNCHGQNGPHYALHDAEAVINKGCTKCHLANLIDEHEDKGWTCSACHESENTDVVTAIENGILDCDACHLGKRHYSKN